MEYKEPREPAVDKLLDDLLSNMLGKENKGVTQTRPFNIEEVIQLTRKLAAIIYTECVEK